MALPTRFVKMSGGGNDFLVFEADGRRLSDADRRAVARLCRRGLSVGADGALFLSTGDAGAVRVDYYNADGGLASFCANGTRCAARYAMTRRISANGSPVLQTGWAPIRATVEGDRVTLALPEVEAPGSPLAISGEGLPRVATPIRVGVPHLVVFVHGLADLAIARLAPPLRRHPAMPEGANVNFVEVEDSGVIHVRTFERGVEGETLACGSGVVASAIVSAFEKDLTPPVRCSTAGGAVFSVDFRENNGGATAVTLTGDAREIYAGELAPEAFSE